MGATITEANERDDNDYSDNDEEKSLLIDDNPVIVYGKRWLMLVIVAANEFTLGFIGIGLVSINNIASQYYNATSFFIMLPNIITTVLIPILVFPTSFMISKYGVKPVLIFSSLLLAFSMTLRCFAYPNTMYWLVMLSQILTTFAYPAISETPGHLSATWFPEKERVLATSIAASQFPFGAAVGFLYPTLFVKPSGGESAIMVEMETYYGSLLALSIIALIMTFFYRESPPTPPHKDNSHAPKNEECILNNLRTVCKERYFMILVQSYGISMGLLNTSALVANPIITSKYHYGYESGLGWTVFAATIVGVFTSACTGHLLGKWHTYRLAAFLSDAFTAFIWLAYLLVFMYTDHWYVTCALLILYGAANQPKVSICIEQAAQMTYPVPVHTSTAILIVFATIYTFGFSTIFGLLLERGYINTVCWSIFGLYLTAAIFSALAKTEIKRVNYERNE